MEILKPITGLLTRKLKVYLAHSERSYRQYRQVSEIRMKGLYLAQAGFLPGDEIQVSIQEKQIIITKKSV